MSLNNLNNDEKKIESFFKGLAANAPSIADRTSVFESIAAEAAKQAADDISLVKPFIFLLFSVICAVASFIAGARIIAASNFGAMDAFNFTLVSVAGKTAEYMAPDEFAIAAAISISLISIVIVMSSMFMIAIVQKTIELYIARTASVKR